MRFRTLRQLDQILGKFLFFVVVPLCGLIAMALPKQRTKKTAKTITILKLHGGGSLMMALPALLGLRAKYPNATITLVGTPETGRFAELTGVFDAYELIDSSSPVTLGRDSFKALKACLRHDIFIDLEPHSALAALFAAMTFATRRIGFVKAQNMYRARSYTTPVYFNPDAPIYVFYDQIAAVLDAEPATVEAAQAAIKGLTEGTPSIITPEHARPVIYVSAFTSKLSPERMMPSDVWIDQLKKRIGTTQSFTLMIGGGADESGYAKSFSAKLQAALPLITIAQSCGTRSLKEAIADINQADEFWGVDSGTLHIARWLGKNCSSFWGPSNPAFRLRSIPGLEEKVFYRSFPCSPCVHLSAVAPCRGDNQCMKKLFSEDAPQPITRF
jgi:ADP-heptose:LPS heptosyltransferase